MQMARLRTPNLVAREPPNAPRNFLGLPIGLPIGPPIGLPIGLPPGPPIGLPIGLPPGGPLGRSASTLALPALQAWRGAHLTSGWLRLGWGVSAGFS